MIYFSHTTIKSINHVLMKSPVAKFELHATWCDMEGLLGGRQSSPMVQAPAQVYALDMSLKLLALPLSCVVLVCRMRLQVGMSVGNKSRSHI